MARFQASFKPRVPGLPADVRPGSRAFFRMQRKVLRGSNKDMADIIKRYESLIRHLKRVTPTILFNAMMPVRNKAAIYVPKKTGALMASENIETGVDSRGNPVVSLTYGDGIAYYAALVHEQVHLNHAPPTRAKYLQSALEEEMDSFLTSIAIDYAAAMS